MKTGQWCQGEWFLGKCCGLQSNSAGRIRLTNQHRLWRISSSHRLGAADDCEHQVKKKPSYREHRSLTYILAINCRDCLRNARGRAEVIHRFYERDFVFAQLPPPGTLTSPLLSRQLN